ncbi:MAG TPA: hypothetical protein VFU22_06725 [Roseiflexaceae bacterium]|nr:hypothetical protein [Roseiflexaceae bacterium]
MRRAYRITLISIAAGLLIAGGLKLMSIAAIASLTETSQTEHFVFAVDERDRSLLTTLPAELEGAHDRIAADLQHPLQRQVVVRIYPDVHRRNMAIGNPFPWPRAGGNASPGLIETISPHAIQDQPFPPLTALAHELTHVVVMEINPQLHRGWLQEGLASYEMDPSPSGYRASVKTTIRDDVAAGRIPSFTDLNVVTSNWPRFWQMHGYEFSYTFVEFVRNDHGADTLNRLIRAPDDYSGVFNRTEDQVWDEWVVYLKRHYR